MVVQVCASVFCVHVHVGLLACVLAYVLLPPVCSPAMHAAQPHQSMNLVNIPLLTVLQQVDC